MPIRNIPPGSSDAKPPWLDRAVVLPLDWRTLPFTHNAGITALLVPLTPERLSTFARPGTYHATLTIVGNCAGHHHVVGTQVDPPYPDAVTTFDAKTPEGGLDFTLVYHLVFTVPPYVGCLTTRNSGGIPAGFSSTITDDSGNSSLIGRVDWTTDFTGGDPDEGPAEHYSGGFGVADNIAGPDPVALPQIGTPGTIYRTDTRSPAMAFAGRVSIQFAEVYSTRTGDDGEFSGVSLEWAATFYFGTVLDPVVSYDVTGTAGSIFGVPIQWGATLNNLDWSAHPSFPSPDPTDPHLTYSESGSQTLSISSVSLAMTD